MGWNELNIKTPHPLTNGVSGDVYFVHSYCFNATNPQNIVATTTYGSEITAILANDNIMGVQFHPEKSQKLGLKLITNFLSI
jgi:glutamine amidotransferase